MSVKEPARPQPFQIDRSGRVSLPVDIRKVLGVEVGDFVAYEVDGKAVRIRKVKISVE